MLTALDEHLWTGGVPAPLEYLTMVLWRDVYKCTPLELETLIERFGIQRVLADLAMANIEAENRRLKWRNRAR